MAWIAVVIGVGALSGCSGGGGGDDTPVAPAAITTTNATTIASAVMVASLDGGDLGSLASFATAGPMAAPKSARILSAVSETQNAQVNVLLKRAQAVAQAAIPPETTACTDGGTVTLSGNIGNQGTLSPNDTIVFDFASCVEGDTTVSGRFSMQVTSFSGDVSSGTFVLGVNVTISSFQVTVGTDTATAGGSIAISINAISGGALATTVTSSSISVTEGGVTRTLTHYSSIRTLAAGSFTLDVSGTLTSTNFSGSVTFDTNTLLQGTDGAFAFLGQVVITGANGATIKVIALDGTFVRIEVDTNGDGMVDATADVSWSDLTQ